MGRISDTQQDCFSKIRGLVVLKLGLRFGSTSDGGGGNKLTEKTLFAISPNSETHFLERPLSPSHRGMCQCSLQENYFYDNDTCK